ncbi:hypothetical protein C0995_014838 [Termitomyces sp. Mi166|nr:hypothetical protein C0995_014838 [Termitomyces sp. Mi166\
MECQPTSSRVKVEDLVTDEEEQSTASALEATRSEQSFWDQPVGLPNIQWAYDPRMLSEWNEAVASMMIKNRVASLQPVGEVYCQPTADEISEPSNIFIDGASLKAKIRLMTEDTGEAHLRALREWFEPAGQACQKRIDIGKDKPQKLSEDDFPRLRQAWQQEFADIINRTKEELPPWREVNHEINLIDKSRQYKYHLPRCPRVLQEQLHEKTNRYLNAKWWEPWAAMQAAPLLCIPKKDGTLQTVLDVRQHK